VVPSPLAAAEALGIVDEWRTRSVVLEPGPNYWSVFRRLVIGSEVRGDLISDAHLAALAIEHDATLYSADRDFHRFAGLRVINPLV
jgi:predicted nucleic acid-binding protein